MIYAFFACILTLIRNRLRGIGGNFIILEEAAFINENTVRDIIMPIIKLKRSCFVAISSLAKGSNLFTRMLAAREHMTIIEIVYICEDCQHAGVKNVCPHKLAVLPPWISEDNDFAKYLFGDDEDIAREQMGIIAQSNMFCFKRNLVEEFISRPRVTITDPVRHVFVTIDPCGGSKKPENGRSEFAIVSICYPNTTIVGIDAVDVVRTEDYEPILMEHIRKIRAKRYFENATIVLDVEANNFMEAGNIQSMVRRMGNVLCLDDAGRKPGVETTPAAKEEMVDIFDRLLHLHDIRIDANIVTSHPNPHELITRLGEQCVRYRRYIKPSQDVTRKSIHTFSGKGDRGNEKDDICLSLQRGCRSRHRFMFDKVFRHLL